MQEYKNDMLAKTSTGDMDQLFEVAKQRLQSLETDHFVIGQIPKVGKVFTLFGLRYEVIESHDDGRIVLKILGPNKE